MRQTLATLARAILNNPARETRSDGFGGHWGDNFTNLADYLEQLGVGPVGFNSALTMSAVWAAVRILSEGVASLPLKVYERLPNGGKAERSDLPIYDLLHTEFNQDLSSFRGREVGQAQVVLTGNAYFEISREPSGRPVALRHIDYQKCEPRRDTLKGALYYQCEAQRLDPRDVLHIPGLGREGDKGLSVIALARRAVELGLQAEIFGNAFLKNGSQAGGFLHYPGRLGPDARKNLRESMEAMHKGAANAGRFALLEEGLTWTNASIPAKDAQFIESRKFQINEIARWFNLPPHLLGDLERASFSNIEQQQINFVVLSLRPWLVRWESEINRKLFTDAERRTLFAEFVVEGLLRGDSESRGRYYTSLFQIGGISPNEIRRRENLNPVDGGDELYRPLNMAPLNAPPAAAPDPEPTPQAPASGRAECLGPVAADAAATVLRREIGSIRGKLSKSGLTADEFAEWMDAYYPRHADYLRERLTPALSAIAASRDVCGADIVTAIVDSLVGESVAALSAALRSDTPLASVAETLALWERDREAAITDTLLTIGV